MLEICKDHATMIRLKVHYHYGFYQKDKCFAKNMNYSMDNQKLEKDSDIESYVISQSWLKVINVIEQPEIYL